MYNPMRANRPGSQSKQSRDFVHKIIEESQPTCDFCNAENSTVSFLGTSSDGSVCLDIGRVQAEEEWGRVRTVHSVTAANVFPISGPHSGLVVANNHNLLNLTEEEVRDMFMAAREWYAKVGEEDGELVAPMMIWDTLPHGGASQIHPHLQVRFIVKA